MLPTFVIGLREGIEASLIVGIIAAFLIQRGDRPALRPVWIGVAIALAISAGAAVALNVIGRSLPLRQREALEASLALIAVAGVTYMTGVIDEVEDIVPSTTTSLTVSLEPGSYALICNLPARYAQGMRVAFTVA